MSSSDEVEPTVRPGLFADKGDDDSTSQSHPAYGEISVNKASIGGGGGMSLLGTDFQHRHVVTLRICEAELHRSLSHDDVFSGKELIEVVMSEAQWVTLVSGANTGAGTPCTLSRVMGKRRPDIPPRVQRDVHEKEMEGRMRKLSEAVRNTRKEIEDTLGPSLSEKKRKTVMQHLDKLDQDLTSNLPWYAEVYRKHMKRVVESAKVEVNAYMQSTLAKLGMARLGKGEEVPEAPLLMPGESTEDSGTE